MKNFFAEFKKFITRGNVLDMSVGVIVGGAFTAIVNGLSNNILKPIINWLLAIILGTDSLSDIYTILLPGYSTNAETGAQVLDLAQSIYIDWGAFINAIINFLLIAIVLFSIVKFMNSLSKASDDLKNNAKMEKEAVKKYKKEGLKRKEAIARYKAELKAAEEKAAAEKAAAEEAEKNKETEMTVLKDIRDLLIAQAAPKEEAKAE